MPTKKKSSDSTTKKWAAKPKTAKAKNLGSGGAYRAAKALKGYKSRQEQAIREALGK